MTVNFSTSPGTGSVPVSVIRTGIPEVVWTFLLSAVGGDGLLKPSTLSSVILAQLFKVFPLTVTLTNLPVVPPGKTYVSNERVVPLLLPVNTFVNVVPSFETDITKLF
jgi:hypothetical protein